MIEFTTYKNRPAVSIKTSTIKGVFLYDDGAKLTSLTNLKNGKELLAVKDGNTYKVLEYNGNLPGYLPIEVPELEVQDIDTMTDWKLAELKYEMMEKNK